MLQRIFSPWTHSKFSQTQGKMLFPNSERKWWQLQAANFGSIWLILHFRCPSDPMTVSAATLLSLMWAALCQDTGIR